MFRVGDIAWTKNDIRLDSCSSKMIGRVLREHSEGSDTPLLEDLITESRKLLASPMLALTSACQTYGIRRPSFGNEYT